MLKKLLKRAKLNNAGMTLVELLIAMGILAVSVIPLLYAFVNANRYNARGRELQQTTILAHTVMENCKAFSKEEIDAQILTSHDFLDYTVADYNTKVDGDDIIYFMSGVEVENFVYDIEMTLTPRGIKDTADADYTSAYKMMQMESMNPYLDAVFAADSSLGSYTEADGTIVSVTGATSLDEQMYITALEMIAQGIKDKAALESVITSPLDIPVSDLADELSDGTGNEMELYRTIYINAEKVGTNYEQVNIVYEYRFSLTLNRYTYVYSYFDETGTEQNINLEWNLTPYTKIGESVTYTIYDNTTTYDEASGAQVQNIYLCYYPGYKSSDSLCPIEADNIVMNNGLGRPVNIYLIKQKNPAYINSSLTSLEAGYTPAVQGNYDGTDAKLINVYHNYMDDLSGSNGIMFTLTENHFKLPDASVQPDAMIMEDEDVLMYTVSVSIYKSGAYDAANNEIIAGSTPMITLNGTSLN